MEPSAHPGSPGPAISVVISTHNRAALLPEVVEALFAQRDAPPFEVILVDNASTDGTRDLVETLSAEHPELRAAHEPRPGVSHGRNLGIALARAPIVAFTDDDVRVSPDWLATIDRCLKEHPEADWIGGRVLPRWTAEPPGWLTRAHWAPLALLDYGEAPLVIGRTRRLCLLTASLAVRSDALHAVGGFSPQFTRCVDHELLIRLWNTGRQGLYWPDLVVETDVPPERMTKAYHRMWHKRTARLYAQIPPEDLFSDENGAPAQRVVSLFGVPSFTFRELLGESRALLRSWFRGSESTRFHHELRVRHLLQYMTRRYLLCRRQQRSSRLREIREFFRQIRHKKGWVG
ncbi:MAG TPA: glycosyltransferase [Vicinamibacterales bacterium]|nr:glycosyltransferase [Vicinamibacterales bacterium]